MIPLSDDRRTRRLPAVTVALIGANVLVFVFEMMLPRYGLTLRGFSAKMGVVPFELAHGYDVPPADLVPWWATMFTAMFVHGGWLHLIFDVLYLWIFGSSVEDRLGRLRFLGFYLACGMVATAAQVVSSTTSIVPVIGAGGAISGVLGAYLVLYPRARVLTVPAWILLVVWFGLQALQGALSFAHPQVAAAFVAHVGGFVAGLALAVPLDRWGRRPGGGPAVGRSRSV